MDRQGYNTQVLTEIGQGLIEVTLMSFGAFICLAIVLLLFAYIKSRKDIAIIARFFPEEKIHKVSGIVSRIGLLEGNSSTPTWVIMLEGDPKIYWVWLPSIGTACALTKIGDKVEIFMTEKENIRDFDNLTLNSQKTSH